MIFLFLTKVALAVELENIHFSIENNKILNFKQNLEKKETSSKKIVSKTKPSQYYIYQVAPGDSIWKIAKRFGVSVEFLKEVNNLLEGSVIYVGQKIIIPTIRRITLSGFPIFYAASRPKEYVNAFDKINEELIVPVSGHNWGVAHYYNAVDIAAPCGQDIYASHSGKIKYTGYSSSYGYYIIIESEKGFSSLYGHLSKILVKNNSYVNQGDLIGKVGKTGITTGCHLHFELRGIENPLIKE